ncbi:MAG TPA: MerR family DNA-binding protein [Terriglobia bacterium]|nr:MerR family DNA-binding protein [Terriglobia bacterium]
MGRTGILIGKVSERTGLSVDAIRFYERRGLLERKERSEGGFRRFNPNDVRRIHFIRRAQRLGFSLPEVRELLILQHDENGACGHVRDLLLAKLTDVRSRLRGLGAMERQPTESLRQCERKLSAGEAAHHGPCPVLEEIARRGSDEG